MGTRAFKVTVSGNYDGIRELFGKVQNKDYLRNLDTLAQKGVDALRDATPIDSGKTADSWSYEITENNDGISINYINTNVNDHVNVAIILQTGHGTRNGGYVAGRDYINPALRSIFDQIAESAWQEVTS